MRIIKQKDNTCNLISGNSFLWRNNKYKTSKPVHSVLIIAVSLQSLLLKIKCIYQTPIKYISLNKRLKLINFKK